MGLGNALHQDRVKSGEETFLR